MYVSIDLSYFIGSLSMYVKSKHFGFNIMHV